MKANISRGKKNLRSTEIRKTAKKREESTQLTGSGSFRRALVEQRKARREWDPTMMGCVSVFIFVSFFFFAFPFFLFSLETAGAIYRQWWGTGGKRRRKNRSPARFRGQCVGHRTDPVLFVLSVEVFWVFFFTSVYFFFLIVRMATAGRRANHDTGRRRPRRRRRWRPYAPFRSTGSR